MDSESTPACNYEPQTTKEVSQEARKIDTLWGKYE